MRISAIETVDAGPLGTQTFDFVDGWSGEVADKILLSGPNGCGKSTLLDGIATVWRLLGYWLTHNRAISGDFNFKQLPDWGGFMLKIDDMCFGENPTWIGFDRNNIMTSKIQHNQYMIEIKSDQKHKYEVKDNINNKNLKYLIENYHKMKVSDTPSSLPNIIFLDAEKRRWSSSPVGIGEFIADDLKQRWLSEYQPHQDSWRGQLEAGLLAMKAAKPDKFTKLLNHFNQFLNGKQVLPDIILGRNRIQVQISNKAKIHRLDDLSSGERQVLIQLYMVERWMEKGGVVLIDEPDLYLHPSLIAGFLAQLEKMVAERNGQLIITSHVPEVWERYESRGMRVQMELQE